MSDFIFGIITYAVMLFLIAMVALPFVASYLWVAGIIPWYWFALTAGPAFTAGGVLWFAWSMRDFSIWG